MAELRTIAGVASKYFAQKYKNPGIHITKKGAEAYFDRLLGLLYPQLQPRGSVFKSADELSLELDKAQLELNYLLRNIGYQNSRGPISNLTDEFFHSLDGIVSQLDEDIDFALESNPSLKSRDQIIICYPGFYALSAYRISNFFYKKKVPIFPRLISEYAHRVTQMDINPGATIAAPFFPKDATGLVIGEMSHIGKRVKIGQNVTLGAIAVYKELQDQKRHPTIEDDVEICANSVVLGGKTVIGKGSIIESNVLVVKSVPPYSRVSQVKKQIQPPLEIPIQRTVERPVELSAAF
mmetsp:Transcript_39764/g.46286  ORF Transcript_39764/g.46286 Transcript_39764/m.46286 type:complete len:294 (+) Transcript_39764:15-896(+)|eukprot:CAMPEP_0176437940 /NCGR_PEP_ID=MMETSP0127-20121128/18949_1 /TAXON_ID=938130 /ORGANISM="Platyophrya macrostoma, Strain WH" /LENGTH=293 /DNA_ID=CAMNT_0017821719 /DNA_START=14 /DNA_END=895 /DNA_ORIENTATION=-